MKKNTKLSTSMIRPMRGVKRGQALVITMVAFVALVGMTGFAIDIGHVYSQYQQLQDATRAAALAGASVLSDSSGASATTAAGTFSAGTGDQNSVSGLSNVSMVSGYPKLECLSSIGTICSAYPSNDNAIAVSETANVPTTFLSVLGISSIPITATATAAAGGGNNSPYNVQIVLDTTQSMNDTDSDSQCNSSRISCALSGIQVLLGTLSPCAAGKATCGTASNTTVVSSIGAPATSAPNVSNAVDQVGLMVFPGLASASQVSYDYACPTQNPTSTHYNNGPIYQIIPFSSDYRTSDTATSLSTGSNLVITAGGGCSNGVAAPGGQGTFYAGAIDAAQAQLVANARPNTKNVMIILSDGDASASTTQMGGTVTSYPSTQQCHQAVTEAQKAAAAGTIVYTVAYGAESSGCSTDTNPSITPCQTMQNMASSSQNFYSDYTAKGGTNSCVSASHPTSNLNEIFKEISQSLTVARLIPNNAT
jgi:Flp pilus assembly protein TadG